MGNRHRQESRARVTVDKIRHPKKRAFLAAYRQSGNIRASTEAAGIDRTLYYVWCEKDLVFAAAARQAKEEFGDLLEAKLAQMAMKQDNVTAIIVALKMAGRFVDRVKSEVSGPDGNPVQFDVQTSDRLASRIASLAARVREDGVAEHS